MKKSLETRLRSLISASACLSLILVACFVVVGFSIKSYGASYDETSDYVYAEANLQVYLNQIDGKPYEELINLYDLRYKGPAYFLVSEILGNGLNMILPALDTYDTWHLINFATFLTGAWLVFCLSRHFVSPWAAVLGALLYLTQPLLWGHGVMNHKDIPFATFFLATVTVGLKMVDQLAQPASQESYINSSRGVFLVEAALQRIKHPEIILDDFRRTISLLGNRKYFAGPAILLAGLALADRVFGHFISLPLITTILTQAYDPNAASWLRSLFLRLTSNSGTISLADYIEKALRIVNVTEFGMVLLVFGSLLILWFSRATARKRWIVMAGILGGMTISIRVLGPAAIGLVALYALLRLRRSALIPILAYLAIGLAAMYFFWPFLWNAPVEHLIESLWQNASFPWTGRLRFDGTEFLACALPWYYLPKLIAIQFTLPLLALAAAGLALLMRSVGLRRLDWKLAGIPIVWFLAPLAGVVLVQPNMYDNFRQFLFIMPPLFIFAGAAVDAILGWLKSTGLKIALCLAILLPGILTGIWLHPYEYTYYNALAGWTGEVERQYETDYWYTAMCEAGRYISTVAPEGSKIAFTDDASKTLFLRCTDKKYLLFVERLENSQINPNYAVVSSRYNDDLEFFRKMPVIHTIERGKSVFAVIKKAQ